MSKYDPEREALQERIATILRSYCSDMPEPELQACVRVLWACVEQHYAIKCMEHGAVPRLDKCIHLASGDGLFAKHSDITLRALSPEQGNTTDYVYTVDMALCVLCSGYVWGKLASLAKEGIR